MNEVSWEMEEIGSGGNMDYFVGRGESARVGTHCLTVTCRFGWTLHKIEATNFLLSLCENISKLVENCEFVQDTDILFHLI